MASKKIYALLIILGISSIAMMGCGSEDTKEVPLEEYKPEEFLNYKAEKPDKKLQTYFEELHRVKNFNGNVLIAKKGKIIYEGSFGWADYLHKRKLNIHTQFQLASVSKPFTAAAILLLAERGQLKLYQTVDHFIPNFPYPNITIHHLLTHQSGLTNYVYFSERVWKDKKQPLNNFKAVNLFVQHKPGRYYPEPGKVFHYNNTNYMLLGAIIEKVSGMSYGKFLKKNIFDPCGMKHTKVLTTNRKEEYPKDIAVGHDRSWRYSVVPNYLDGTSGDKGIYSTVEDLHLFDIGLKKGFILKKPSLNQAYACHIKKEHLHFGYGYGWRTFNDEEIDVVYHTGWWHGFKNLYVRNLSKGITIVILSNFVNGSINKLDGMFDILDMPVIRRDAYEDN